MIFEEKPDATEIYIQGYINRARAAQKEFEKYNQEQVDKVVKVVAKVVFDNAEKLAKMAVEETGMGKYEDKILKNKSKARVVWNHLKDKKSVGIIERDEATGITKVAKPIGVVAAITPSTNPIVTAMTKIMFALKGRNAIIITPHHNAVKCSTETVNLINAELKKAGAPDNIVQILDSQSRLNTKILISSADMVIATGGMGMVKAAYSSGKPAIGVGVGNVQCIVDKDADIKDVVPKVITGRAYDNGILCSGEQAVIVPEEKHDEIIEEFKRNGAYYVGNPQEKEAFRKVLFTEAGTINGAIVGKSAHDIAELAMVKIPEDTRIIVIDADGIGEEEILSKEKMCPVLSVYSYKDFKNAVEIARANLELEGKGHSIAIHSNSVENIEYAAERLDVSRFTINQIASNSLGGSFNNGFAPTNTLGCVRGAATAFPKISTTNIYLIFHVSVIL